MPLIDPRSGPSYGATENDHPRLGDRERDQERDQERDRLLQDGYPYHTHTEGEDSETSSLDEALEGVRKIEAINMTWTTRSLIIAYVRFVWLADTLSSSSLPPLIRRKVYS